MYTIHRSSGNEVRRRLCSHVYPPLAPPGVFSRICWAKPTRWVIYGTPSDDFKKANADFHPVYMTPFDGFTK